MKHLFVSGSGSGTGDGSRERPFAALEQARDRLRSQAAAGGVPDGATVWLRGGEYRMDRAFDLDPEDSGREGAPVVYRACEGETVRLTGGPVIPEFRPVSDPAVLARLSPGARGRVLEADLKAAGIANNGSFSRRGFGLTQPAAHLELFLDGVPMTVAQWPNAGSFLAIADVLEVSLNEWKQKVGTPAGGFRFEGGAAKRWAVTDDLWVHGYWCWDWANSFEKVARFDPEAGTVLTEAPHCAYAFRAGQRFYFLNILEELDEPGEFFVDPSAGRLYFWPPVPLAGREVRVSVLEEPLIRIRGASHVVVRDLILEAGRSSGVVVTGGEHVTIGGCTVRDMGIAGIEIRGGAFHRVAGCTIAYPGDSGVILEGGDRKTLEAAGHEVVNNRIHHFSRWSRTYKPGILVTGCGMRIAHNALHDAPHTAILYGGNEIAIEANEIYRVCLETGDAGAIYTGRDYTFRGNSIRHNFIHHMGGVGMGTSAIYMDDCVSGHLIEGNIVWGGDAIWLGGGRDFIIRGNLFIACKGAVCFDSRGVDPRPVWQNMVNQTMKERLEAVHAYEPPYSALYPEIAELAALLAAGKGVPPEHNTAGENWCVDCEPVRVWDRAKYPKPEWLKQQGNVVDPDPGFCGGEWGDFRMMPDSKAVRCGFLPPPAERIGLIADGFRPSRGPLVRSRLVAGRSGGGRVEIRAGLRNDGTERESGEVRLLAGESGFEERWTYDLGPGEILEKTIDTPLAKAGKTNLLLEAVTGFARPSVCELENPPA